MVGVSSYRPEQVAYVFELKHNGMAKSDIVTRCKERWPRKEWTLTKITYILNKYKHDERYNFENRDRQPWDPPTVDRQPVQPQSSRKRPAQQTRDGGNSPAIRKPTIKRAKVAAAAKAHETIHSRTQSSSMPDRPQQADTNPAAGAMRNLAGGPLYATLTRSQPMRVLNSPIDGSGTPAHVSAATGFHDMPTYHSYEPDGQSYGMNNHIESYENQWPQTMGGSVDPGTVYNRPSIMHPNSHAPFNFGFNYQSQRANQFAHCSQPYQWNNNLAGCYSGSDDPMFLSAYTHPSSRGENVHNSQSSKMNPKEANEVITQMTDIQTISQGSGQTNDLLQSTNPTEIQNSFLGRGDWTRSAYNTSNQAQLPSFEEWLQEGGHRWSDENATASTPPHQLTQHSSGAQEGGSGNHKAGHNTKFLSFDSTLDQNESTLEDFNFLDNLSYDDSTNWLHKLLDDSSQPSSPSKVLIPNNEQQN